MTTREEYIELRLREIASLANMLNSTAEQLKNVREELDIALHRTELSERSLLVIQKALIGQVNEILESELKEVMDRRVNA